MFKLTQSEFNNLKISKASQNVTSLGGVQYAPFAFTLRKKVYICLQPF